MINLLRKKLIEAQKSQNDILLSTLRLLIAEYQKKEISLRSESKELQPEDLLKIFKKQIKNRRETIPMYRKAGREETAVKEEKEIDVILDLIKELYPTEDISNL